MIPSSKAFSVLVLALGLAGCASTGGVPTEGPRRPDGVAIDPISAPPRPEGRADTAESLVTLRTPLGVDRAVAAVAELFRKIVAEDGDGLESLFASRALAIQPGNTPGSSPQAALWWQQRLRRMKTKYAQLAGETIYREAELDIFRAEDAAHVSRLPAVPPDQLEANDVVIRVPILTTRLGPDRLFADELTVWLRREGERFRIHQIIEDFQLN